jgi:hypothetical protein
MAEADLESGVERLKKRRLARALILVVIFFATNFILYYFNKDIIGLIRNLFVSVLLVIITDLAIKKARVRNGTIEMKPYSNKTALGLILLVFAALFYSFMLIHIIFPSTDYLLMFAMGLIGFLLTIIGIFLLKKR